FEEIPARVIEKAKLHLLDALGIALAATREPYAESITSLVREWGGAPQATLWGHGDRLPAAHAALANGSYIHGLDFDDTHTASIAHMSACVIPTALAAGEAAGAGGREILAAVVAGYEIIARIGAAAPGAFHARGFHATPVCGAFGSAAVAGRLLGIGPQAIAHALGTVGSQASGIQEFLDDGSWVKRLHPGWAAHAGMIAAQLCGRGFLGARKVFEGRFGLYATHAPEGRFDPGELIGGLGERWETLNISFKPYPCCHFNHAAMDAARNLVREIGAAHEEIARVEAIVPEPVIPIVAEPAEHKRRPNTPYAALFSLPYCLALNVVKGGATLEDFKEENLGDPRILALAEKVECRGEPSERFPKYFHGAVRLTLADGRVFEREEPINRGNPENPMRREEVEEKFRRNAARALPPEKVEAAARAALALDDAPDAGDLMAACRP
ncbi:MAG: MmgE/PrpD family protein, partial [bacterium]